MSIIMSRLHQMISTHKCYYLHFILYRLCKLQRLLKSLVTDKALHLAKPQNISGDCENVSVIC